MTQYYSYTYRVIYRVISNTIPLPSFDHVSWKIDVMLIPLHKIILKSKINAMSINAIYEIITHNTINKIIERYDRSNAVPLLLYAAQQSSIFYYSLMRVKCDVDSLYW